MAKLLEKEDVRSLVSTTDNFLFDCDGVLWADKDPIEGSLDTILKLKKLGKRVFYVTNNSSKSRDDYVKKCRDLGFPAEPDEILCTSYMPAQYLKMKRFQGKVYVVGKAESIGKELDDVGIPWIGPGPDPVENLDIDSLTATQLDPEVKCVLVGFDPHISYMKILKAASYLKDPDCLFIGTNEDGCLPLPCRIVIPGTGTMVSAVAVAADRRPIIMGKPEIGMFEVLQGLHNLDPSRSLMTGDRIDTDIVFAKKVGMKSFAVLTGVATLEEIVGDKKDVKPDFYADCLGSLGKHLPS